MSEYPITEREVLLKTARASIQHGLTNQQLLKMQLDSYAPRLKETRACFVTLHRNTQLRGCVGSLLAHQALILDVVQNAYSAAFKDPRFRPLTADEYPQLAIDISILSQPQPMTFQSETDLLSQLRVGIDGLILSDQGHRGTFLPTVWEQLPDPIEFLQHLKAKAGLPTDYWSGTIKIEHYTTELIA